MEIVTKGSDACFSKLYVKGQVLLHQWGNVLMLGFGLCLVVVGLAEVSSASGITGAAGPSGNATQSWSEANYDDRYVRGAVGNLFMLIEGAFGALIMVVAGLGAIIAAAMGAYRAALGMLVVAVGAFVLRSMVSLFFGANYTAVEGTQQGTAVVN